MMTLLLAGAGFALVCIAYAVIVTVREWRRRWVDFDEVYREFGFREGRRGQPVTSIRELMEDEKFKRTEAT